jgi:hypothetical protein
MIIVGFTGTRRGLTRQQFMVIEAFFKDHVILEAHHGDCIGADEEFHDICLTYDVPVILHPPENPKLRAFCKHYRKVMPPRPFLERNHIIVDTCDVLLAAPREEQEPPVARGQGTWSTVRYARRSSKRFRVVWPEAVTWWP